MSDVKQHSRFPQSPPPDESESLRWLARNAKRVANTIERCFPVEGRDWIFAGVADGWRPVKEVLSAVSTVEGQINRSLLPFGHADRRPDWCFTDRGIEIPCVLAAVQGVQACHDRILKHYGLDAVNNTALFTAGYPGLPWAWPNVPKIDRGLLEALDRAADYLLDALERYREFFLPAESKVQAPGSEPERARKSVRPK